MTTIITLKDVFADKMCISYDCATSTLRITPFVLLKCLNSRKECDEFNLMKARSRQKHISYSHFDLN